jgi:hypothetical protein
MLIVFLVMLILLACAGAFVILNSILHNGRPRKDKYPHQSPFTSSWGLGTWYNGAWDAAEKMNASIARGRQRQSSPHKSKRHQGQHHRHKHH